MKVGKLKAVTIEHVYDQRRVLPRQHLHLVVLVMHVDHAVEFAEQVDDRGVSEAVVHRGPDALSFGDLRRRLHYVIVSPVGEELPGGDLHIAVVPRLALPPFQLRKAFDVLGYRRL